MRRVLKLTALIVGIAAVAWGLRYLIRLVLARAEIGGPAFVMIDPRPAEGEATIPEATIPVAADYDSRAPDVSAESA